jgi:hypothetical protein
MNDRTKAEAAIFEVALHSSALQMREFGRQTMLKNFRGIYRVFIKLASPQFIIDRAGEVWKKHARGSGSMSAERLGDRSSEVTYTDVYNPSPGHWAFLHGGVVAALEASGVKNVRLQVMSGGGTGAHCVIRVSWD